MTDREQLRRRVLMEYAKRDYIANVYGEEDERAVQASRKWYALYMEYKRKYDDTPLNYEY